MKSILILFYDGHCGTCHRFIRLLLRLKARERFLFYPLHLYPDLFTGKKDADGNAIRGESIVIVQEGRPLQRSAAIFAILSALDFPWTLIGIFGLIPRSLRDAVYKLIAKNRFRLFGRADPESVCPIASDAVKRLFPQSLPEGLRILSP